ncbi:MAG: hypothetical protein K2I23_05395 [Clostridia bacterium]|nr:hypothetical protein [Clostridia bacterium]
MRKTSVIILSSLLICFLIALTCGLVYTNVTPDKEKVSNKFAKAGYECAKLDFGDYSIRTYTKDGNILLIIWYGDEKLADKSIVTANKVKKDKFVVKRGNAVAIGYEKDIRIFQLA